MPFYTATRMLTTHQVLSFPQASILSSTASLVKFSSRVCTMATFLWSRFLHFFHMRLFQKKCRKRGHCDTHHYLYHVYLNRAANVYLFLYFFNFLSLKSQNIKFLSHFSVRPTKLKLQSSADSRRAVVSYWRKNGH